MKPIRIVCLFLIALLSCKKPGHRGDDVATSSEPSTPLITAVARTTGDVVQKTIGTSGGSITSSDGKVTLNIPAGALESNQTISIQPIENKIPTGIKTASYRFLPHGLQFHVPVKIVLIYSDEDVAGSAPEALSLATQLIDGKWELNKGVTVLDKNAKTVTSSIEHFSDWDWFLNIAMQVGQDVNEGVYCVDPGSSVKIAVVSTVNDKGELIVILPLPSSKVSNWEINGQQTSVSKYGSLSDIAGEQTMAVKKFEAPVNVVPDGNTVAISVDVKNPDPKGMGQFTLVANLMLQFENSFKINGKEFKADGVLAMVSGQNLIIQLSTYSGNVVGFEVDGFKGPGTYQFSTPKQSESGYLGYRTQIDATLSGSGSWTNSKPDEKNPSKLIYSSGTVTIHSGLSQGDVLRATVNGGTYKSFAPYTSGSISASASTRIY